MDIVDLDKRLANDTYYMGRILDSILLLNKNAHYPWFILVPDTNEIEFYRISQSMQLSVLDQVNRLSGFISTCFEIEKINVATIGNVVSQMHVHVIGRHSTDACWPGVVWGHEAFMAYTDEEVNEIRQKLKKGLSGFSPAD